jgi:hypothetical protein
MGLKSSDKIPGLRKVEKTQIQKIHIIYIYIYIYMIADSARSQGEYRILFRATRSIVTPSTH